MTATMEMDDALWVDEASDDKHDVVETTMAREFRRLLGDPAGASAFVEIVCTYTERLRAQAVPVERIIVRLKEVLRAASFAPSRPPSQAHDLMRVERILAAAVLRCIEHYYGSPPTPFPGA